MREFGKTIELLNKLPNLLRSSHTTVHAGILVNSSKTVKVWLMRVSNFLSGVVRKVRARR